MLSDTKGDLFKKNEFQSENKQNDDIELTHSFQCTLSLPPENMRKPYDFFMFSEFRERVHFGINRLS